MTKYEEIEKIIYELDADDLQETCLGLAKQIDKLRSQLEPQVSQTICRFCKHYKKDIEYDKLGSCTNEKIMGDKIILHYCEAFFISEDFGCNKFESKLSG